MMKCLAIGGPWHGWCGNAPSGMLDGHPYYKRIAPGVFLYVEPTELPTTTIEIPRQTEQRGAQAVPNVNGIR